MSKLFMHGTTLEGIEQLMVSNFQLRWSGIVINNYFKCKGGGKDCDISVINVDDNCKNYGYDDWNFKVNVDKKRYKDLAMDCFGRTKHNFLMDRLKELSKSFKGEVFLNYQYKERSNGNKFYGIYHGCGIIYL